MNTANTKVALAGAVGVLVAVSTAALTFAGEAGAGRSLPFDPPGRGAASASPNDEQAPAAETPKAEKPLIVVYPVASEFDGGELGANVRDCLRGHALRGGRLSAFDALTEGEILARAPFKPKPETSLADVVRHAREGFSVASGYAAWGAIEKKADGKGYSLRLLGARIGEEDAELAADETYDCPNVHFIPQHAETFLAKLLGVARRDLERKWPKVTRELDPELCANGDFARGQALPEGWTVVRDDVRDQVALERRPGGAEADRSLAYHIKQATADSSGIAVLSAEVPVEKDAHYRVGADILSKGPKVIIFVKGYAEVGGELREVYNHQARYYPEKGGEWERRLTEAFRPRHPWLEVRKLRVMLYAYHPAGDVWFDNVSVRKVEVDASAAPEPKLPYKKEGGGADR